MMIKLLLFSLGLAGVTVLIHGTGTLYSILHIAAIWKKQGNALKALAVEILVIRLVVCLLVLHLAECAVWAMAYYYGGMLESFQTAMYFSLTSYTTLGYGDVLLPEQWRLLAPIESLVGVLMMGWSTGIIVTVVLRAYTQRLGITHADIDKTRTKGK